MRPAHRAIPIVIATAAAIVAVAALALQGRVPLPGRTFAETGHSVHAPFLAFFDAHGGVSTFGFPLTDTYSREEGVTVQTFQRVQLQVTVRGVELAPIGVTLALGQPDVSQAVAPAFADYYAANGGAGFFGQPLGAARVQNGALVQDFERARLASDPASGVHLANLGSVYVGAFPPPDAGQAAFGLRGTPLPPAGIRASVSVQRPTVGQDGQQTVYVVVEDEAGSPIAGAQGLVVLRYDSASAEVTLPDTDTRGLSSAAFDAPPAAPGTRVIVEAHVLAGETFLTVETTYFQWW